MTGKITSVSYTYNAAGSLISETGKNGTDKVECMRLQNCTALKLSRLHLRR